MIQIVTTADDYRAAALTACSTSRHLTTHQNDYCRHQFRIGGFFPCPLCPAAEASAAPLQAVTPIKPAAPAPKRNSGLSNNVLRPSRTLDLAGKTLAGCAVDRMAANATKQSRFHALMACGHSAIVDGSALMSAQKEGRIMKCVGCVKADRRVMGRGKKRAVKGGGDDGE